MQVNKINNTRMCVRFIFSLLPAFSGMVYAQEDNKLVYEGNRQYYDSNYVQATGSFRQAIKANPKNYKASFNLGNAMYRNAGEIKNTKTGILQGKQKVSPDSLANLVYEEAAQNFAIVANTVSDKDTLHRAWHNIGNCYLQKKDWDQAINAYKKSLRFDPKDEETRYNLAYALKNRPPKQNKGGGGQNQQQNQNQQQQQQQQKISKEDAERLLKALMNAEKKTQDKRKQKQEDASKSNPDKDW